jgi:hypothetical protein
VLSPQRDRSRWCVSLWQRFCLRLLDFVAFSGFAAVALHQGLSGAESCGCFGPVRLSPWYSFGLDIAAAGALLVFPPRATQPGSALSRCRATATMLAALAMGLPGGYLMAVYQQPKIDASGLLAAEGGAVFLAGVDR